MHNVFEKSILEIINQFLSDPVNYLQNRGKMLGKYFFCFASALAFKKYNCMLYIVGKCCVCWLPLKDEKSLEIGMGPSCKKKFQEKMARFTAELNASRPTNNNNDDDNDDENNTDDKKTASTSISVSKKAKKSSSN